MLTRKEAITKENKAYKERIKRLDKFFDFVEKHKVRNTDDTFKYLGADAIVTFVDYNNYFIRFDARPFKNKKIYTKHSIPTK